MGIVGLVVAADNVKGSLDRTCGVHDIWGTLFIIGM